MRQGVRRPGRGGAGLGAGATFQEDTGTNTTGVPKFDFNTGYNEYGDVGYAFGNGFRGEAELFHSQSVVKDNDGALGGYYLFGNVLYDINMNRMFNIDTIFTPYVGAGVGVAYLDGDNIGPIGAGADHINDNSIKFAYQGIAGVSAQIAPQWAVTADYRYIGTPTPNFTDSAHNKDRLDNTSHNVMLGVRYSFNTPPAPAKMTEAPRVQSKAMAAKPVVAPVPQTFQVFFDFDKSDLTPEAKRIVAAAAQEYKGGKFVRIVVTGHTDTRGKDAYNQSLSERRAAAVKTEFAGLGVAADVVTAEGMGEKGLLVPTNDGVREAQNRRAEIVLKK